MKIWKYIIEPPDFTVEMPKDAVVLSVQMQGNLPAIWVLVEPENEKATRRFVAIPTGVEINFAQIQLRFLDTIQSENGVVHHIFEVFS